MLFRSCAVSSAFAQTPLERGAYLVKGPAHCGHCHTQPAAGSPELAGGMRFAELAYTSIAANLTPDPETGVTNWTEENLINGMRNGKKPRGATMAPPMPYRSYAGLSDDDAKAIVAYLRSLKPVVNKTARSAFRTPPPDSWGPEVKSVPPVSDADPLVYGKYLAHSVAACMECHSKPGEGGMTDMVNGLGAGGAPVRHAAGVVTAPNITPSGIGHYSDDDLKKVIKTGVKPDGGKLNVAMPTAYFANMTDEDLSAVVAYLRTLPRK